MQHRLWVLAAFIGLLLLAPISSRRAGANTVTWNATNDFHLNASGTGNNPDGAWSYGQMTSSYTTFQLFNDVHIVTLGGEGNEMHRWGATPEVWKNFSTSQTFFGIAPGELSQHPGPSGQVSVVRWTAPAGVSGNVSVAGQYLAGDSGVMAWSLRLNGALVPLAAGLDSGSFNIPALLITPGDTIDFDLGVAPGHDYSFGNTGLDAAISFDDGIASAAPTPTTACAGGALVGALALWRLRRRPGPAAVA